MSSASPAADASSRPKLSVLVPVYASGDLASETTTRVLEAVASCGPVEIVFCDDGSPDDSLARLEAVRAERSDATIRILSHENRGLAYTLQRLIREARGELAVYLDIDISFDVSHLPRLLGQLADCDIAVASKYVGDEQRRVPLLRRLCSVSFRRLVHSLTEVRVQDIGSGMVAFRREPIARLRLDSSGFAIHTELFDRAQRARLRILESGVPYSHRPGSFSVARHGLLAVRDFLRYRMRG